MIVLLSSILFLIALMLFLIHYKIRFSLKGRMIDKLPGNYAYPIIGNALDFLKDPNNVFNMTRMLHVKYKRFCRSWFFSIPIVSMYEPNDIQVLLTDTKNIEKTLFYNLTEPWLGEGMLLSKGLKWHQRRRMLTPAFHFNILKTFCGIFAEKSELLVEELKEVAGQEVEVYRYIGRSVLNTLCETTMGIEIGQDGKSNAVYRKAVNDASKQIVHRCLRPWLHLPFIYYRTKAGREHLKTIETLHNFTLNVIRSKRAQKSFQNFEDEENSNIYFNKKQRLAMLDLLLLKEKREEIDEIGIQQEVDTFMFEGHDTITLGLNHTLMLIANHLEVQENLYNEIKQVFGNTPSKEATINILQQMKYMDCVLKESLRLYPSAAVIARTLSCDLELEDHTIPAGTMCEVQIYDLHRDSRFYNDPQRFNPERFLPENSESRHPFAYIPFSAGMRNCIGQKYAILEMKCVIASIIKNFELIAITKPEDLTFEMDLVLRPKVPIRMIFNRRCL